MLVTKSKDFEKRAEYYAAKAYMREQYAHVKKIIFIVIANCILLPEKAAYKSDHVVDLAMEEPYLKNLYFTFNFKTA